MATLRRAAAETLGDLGDAHAMVNVVAHLALDFELATNTRLTADAIEIARLCDASCQAAAELRATSATEIHLGA